MEQVILDDIPFQPDAAALRQRLRLGSGGRNGDELANMVREAQAIGRPRALYRIAHVDARGDSHVIIDGVRFDSRVLRVNLERAHCVFPHIVTCGMELHEWANSMPDGMKRFWADAIATLALRSAGQALDEHLAQNPRPGQTACVSPGVFPDFPIRQQRPLFKLLGDPQAAIGVHLLKSCWMVPVRSTSGILYPAEEEFVICELCTSESCPGRRAPFDNTLYDRKYRLT